MLIEKIDYLFLIFKYTLLTAVDILLFAPLTCLISYRDQDLYKYQPS